MANGVKKKIKHPEIVSNFLNISNTTIRPLNILIVVILFTWKSISLCWRWPIAWPSPARALSLSSVLRTVAWAQRYSLRSGDDNNEQR